MFVDVVIVCLKDSVFDFGECVEGIVDWVKIILVW